MIRELAFVLLLALVATAVASTASATERPPDAASLSSRAVLPLQFEPNRGQLDERVDFVARGPRHMLWLVGGEAWLGLAGPEQARTRTGDVVRLRVVGARPAPDAIGESALGATVNVFRGSDPSQWRTGIPTFGRVRYEQIVPGVDWVFYGTPDLIEHDLVLAPGVDPAAIELAVDGAERVSLGATGGLRLEVGAGSITLRPPVTYQHGPNGEREVVASRYALRGGDRVGFEVARFDTSRPLVIDPVIEFMTFYGGSNAEIGFDIAIDAIGDSYIAGTTTSSNLPTTMGAFDEVGRVGGFFDPGDAFVAKISNDGESLLWATYLSGRGLDRLFGIALDAAGDVYVVGDTDSTDDPGTGGVDESYPQVGAAQSGFGGVLDLVVTKLDASGASLVFSTYLGGNDADRSDTELDKPSIGIDSQGRALVSVVSQSTDFHTVAGCNLTSPGPYVVRYAANGASLTGCVGVGGDAFVFLRDLVVDGQDRALVTGYTADPNVVTTAGTFSEMPLMGEDIILVRMNAALTAVETGTYFGDTGDDFANGVAVGDNGAIFVVGRSSSAGFPITIGGPPNGSGTASKLDGAMTGVIWSRALGFFEALAIAVDAIGRPSIVGTDNQDAAFVQLSRDGFQQFETFWGGLFPDFANAIVVDALGDAYVTGETRSSGFPGDTVENTMPFQGSLSGNADAWVLKLRRDDPVLVPVLGTALPLLVSALALAGAWRLRRRKR